MRNLLGIVAFPCIGGHFIDTGGWLSFKDSPQSLTKAGLFILVVVTEDTTDTHIQDDDHCDDKQKNQS
jgi:hypothetical protein